jgi:hypothetical protein
VTQKDVMPVLNRHILTDKAFLATARLRMGEAFSEGAVSPSFDEHLEALTFQMPPVRNGGSHEFTIESAAGPMEAAYDVLLWADAGAPTVIWHHKGGEVPFDRIARQVFVNEYPMEANVITVRMPFHRSRKEFKSGLAYLSRFIAMMAAAVQVTEELLQSPALGRSIHTMVAGYSLGGFVANRHHLRYNSAASYVPLMAGTAQGEPWLSSLPVAAIARQRPDALRQALNFQNEWGAAEHPNVHPVLGRHDQVCRWDVQRPSYGDTKAAAWGVGHVTGWRSAPRIRAKIERHLFEPETAGAVVAQDGAGARG